MQTEQMFSIGLMSGTSCDAIDVAIIRRSGELYRFFSHPIEAELQEAILRLAEPGMDDLDVLGHLDQALGEAFAQAVLSSLEQSGLPASRIHCIGSHGQTVRHRPRRRDGGMPFTLQIGCPARIAERTGITVVSDFRRRDMAAGGEGAPLTPWVHRQLFAHPERNIAVVNIGGIANITWLGSDGNIMGFDAGPGNMLMDALMLELSDGYRAFDMHGELAASGRDCPELLAELLTHPYLAQSPPKSTGREVFGQQALLPLLRYPDIDDATRMRCAAMFTVRSIVEATRFLPAMPDQWLLCGGGVHNHFVVRQLAQALHPAAVMPTDDVGMPADALEAVSFAMLAEATLQGVANTCPEVTGASHAVCGGQITPGRIHSSAVRKGSEQALWR